MTEVEILRDALEHIQRTCRASRTETRRIRWIEQRAQWALDGKAYTNLSFDLPKNVSDTKEKLILRAKGLEARLQEAYDMLEDTFHSIPTDWELHEEIEEWLEKNEWLK